MVVIPPPLEIHHGNDYSLLASLPSIILTHLSLEHLIPAFNGAQVDIFRLLMMKDPSDFANVGIYNPDECRRLSQCVRSIQAHMSYKGLTVIAAPATATTDALPSPSSPSSIYNDTNSSSLITTEQEQKNILRAIEAFDRYAMPSFYSTSSAWSRTSSSPPTPPPLSKLADSKGKVSVRSSFLSTFSDSTITAALEEEDEEEQDSNTTTASSYHSNLNDLDHPPPYYNHSPSSTSSASNNASTLSPSSTSTTNATPKQQTVTAVTSREGRPGLVVPRQPRNLISRVPRPLSMPAYLVNRSSVGAAVPSSEDNATTTTTPNRPASPASTLVPQPPQQRRSLIVLSSPPPDYLDTALMKRWEKCKSCIIPREEEGREELPPYKCTVYKMGHVYIKREQDAPGIRTRWRSWRKLYVEVWGTILRIYRAPPHGDNHSHGNRYRLLGRQPLLATRLPLSQWNRYYYSPLATISLAGAEAGRAWDYTKRPFVLRLTTAHGPQMLLRLSSHVEMISWIEHLQAAINISLDLEQRPMPKFMTLPSRAALTGSTLSARALEVERAREQRRRGQREMLI
ncbi:hypothetical protein BDB00DRAFT_800615 [Zychaea mexicana]|uniref:uncharacterized protein n=1 Tax=Zychaea mexicana TaxID=64656 RepID=UPI0022FE990D|nr:uncharacterized protein BDB00DRAFT_800615 [Zychaea mexicana]KAI9498514.1 hypothetical protein BDB00DRAFT_800615 [Zychaea mexicana]